MHEAKNTRKKRQKQKLPAEKLQMKNEEANKFPKQKSQQQKTPEAKTLPEGIQMPHAKNTKSKKSQNLCML